MQHVHILGICGTFMGAIAQLAKQMGLRVTGSDQHVYPPMSTQLEGFGIEIIQGFAPETLPPKPDLIIVGNVISRGNPAMEYILDRQIPYMSGPQWLFEHVLKDKWVLAVAGTHGKTTTTSMLAWILEYAGFDPGFLIGGVAGNFTQTARLGSSDFFVIEADEYDTAFFDKRAKFVHYHPRTLVIGNLEYDHADIYPDLAAIQTQFHHLLRVIPQNGLVLSPNSAAIQAVFEQGCWSEKQTLKGLAVGGTENRAQDRLENELLSLHTPEAQKLDKTISLKPRDLDNHKPENGNSENLSAELTHETSGNATWQILAHDSSGRQFDVMLTGSHERAHISWPLMGQHNMSNAMAAVAAARHIGIAPALSGEALSAFKGVKRRMEIIAEHEQTVIYDDFAHHPTAIHTTLDGLRMQVGKDAVITVIIEPRSNTMKMGVHNANLNQAVSCADHVFWFDASQSDELSRLLHRPHENRSVFDDFEALLEQSSKHLQQHFHRPHHIVIMSNGGFNGIHQKLITQLV